MENLGVLAGDSRDSLGQKRFFPFIPEHHVIKGEISLNAGLSLHSAGYYPDWYLKYMYYQ